MKKYKRVIILINLLILIGFFNNSILQKEELLTDGQFVLLELAPVDPSSLMQGDYMRLNYDISNNIDTDSISKTGFYIVKLNKNGVAEKVRIQEKRTPINENELLIKYNSRKWRGINIGAELYFFQEGEREKYEKAKYGGIKIDNKGNSLLIGLYDKNRIKIE